MNTPPPKIVIPKLTAREREGLQDYWRIYEQHRPAIDQVLLRKLASIPQFRSMFENGDPLATAEQQANEERQRRAVYHDDWEPFLTRLWAQGQVYAHTEVGFRTWFEIVSEFRRLMRPYLLDAYGSVPGRLLAAMDGADVFIEIMMSTIGDSYLAAKEHLIASQHQSIRESEARYRTLFESAAVSIWDEDFSEVKKALDELRSKGVTDFRDYFARHPEFVFSAVESVAIRDVNAQSLRTFGAASKEELMQSLNRIVVPETMNTFTEEMLAIADGKTYFEGEAVVKTLQGEIRDVLFNMYFPGGQLEHTIVSIMDITERKRMKESLRSSEERFAKAFSASPDAIIISQLADGVIIEANESWKTLFNYDRSEVIGRSPLDLDVFANPEDRARAVHAVRQQGHVRDFGLDIRRKSGEIRHASLSAELIEINGVNCLLTILRDVTEQKQAEEKIRRMNEELEERVIERTRRLEQTNQELAREVVDRQHAEKRFRGLLESAPDSIVVVDSRGTVVLVNTQFHHSFGYSNEEILGETVERLVPERYRSRHPGMRDGYFRDPRRRPMGTGLALQGMRKDGSEFPVEISLSPFETHEGILVTAAIRDITDRKLAEEKINKLNAELEQRAIQLEATNKELEAFSYSVSHDLRAPLRTIDGFSLAVLEDFGDQLTEEGRSHLVRIRAASQRMAQLIDDLLDLSRVTRTPLTLQPTNLSAVARQVIHDLKQAEPDRSVETLITPNIIASSDGRLMKIVLENLLHNAWKFTSKQPAARIEFGTLDDPSRGQVFYVRDNGAGFNMAYMNKMFGAFQRLHANAEFPGIGIGLAIVQRIINRHGGHIWAEGEEGHGATFYFTL